MGLFTTAKSDKAKTKKLKEEGCVVTLSIEIPPQEVTDMTQTSLVRLQNRARIPGFRAGKAPLDVVKQHFTGHAREEALDALIRKHVPAAIEELKLRVVETPSVEDVKWKDGEPLGLQVRVEVAPTPTAKDYAKIAVTRKAAAADAKALEKRLEDLRESHARLEAAKDETVGPKHFAVIDYAATRDGKPLPNAKGTSELVDMSAEQSVEGLTAGLLGMKRGESKNIVVKLGGKDAQLSVTVTEIKEKLLPAVDAEFAKDLGFEALDELKAKLKEVLDREAKNESEADSVRQIEEALVKSNPFALPPTLVERQLEGMMERMKRQLAGSAQVSDKVLADLREKLKPKAEDEVRLAFVMTAIAEKEKIEATDADLAAELEAGLKEAETDAKKKDLQDVFAKRKDQISHMIRERKTMAFLKEKAVYKDA
ncbi:MAG TPA: trigger factor [Elusimicrobiota bacterium]|jgi:trigger factor|nr:trigger factor [Elusimicrobiota bacterium]